MKAFSNVYLQIENKNLNKNMTLLHLCLIRLILLQELSLIVAMQFYSTSFIYSSALKPVSTALEMNLLVLVNVYQLSLS